MNRLLICIMLLSTSLIGAAQSAPAASLGRLAYLHDGSLWVKELPDGESKQIARGGQLPRWSRSGEWLMYHAGVQVWLARPTGADAHALQGGAPINAFAWSPLIDTIAYATKDNEIWIANADGSADQKVFAPTIPNPNEKAVLEFVAGYGIAWSPDAQWLAFALTRFVLAPTPGNTHSGLWRIRPDGRDATEIYNTGEQPLDGVIFAQWSPNGQRVFFWPDPYFSASFLADGVPLHTVSTNGGPPRQLTEPMLLYRDFLSVSPDKQFLAISEGSRRDSWMHKHITRVEMSSGARTPLTDEQSAAISPAWSPDSQRIAYVAAADVGDVVGGPPAKMALSQRRIWLMNRDGSNKRQLTHDERYRDERPLCSADGRYLLFVRLEAAPAIGKASLWLVPSSGGEPQQVVDDLTLASLDPTQNWFGYYGHINWDDYFDWWRGAAPPTLPNTGGETAERAWLWLAIGLCGWLGLKFLTWHLHIRGRCVFRRDGTR